MFLVFGPNFAPLIVKGSTLQVQSSEANVERFITSTVSESKAFRMFPLQIYQRVIGKGKVQEAVILIQASC